MSSDVVEVGALETAWIRFPLPRKTVDKAAQLVQDARAKNQAPKFMRPLHLNESPYPPSALAVKAMELGVEKLNRYPDPAARELCNLLAVRSGIPASRIVCANGSEELIQVICTLGASVGDEAVVPAPAFPGIHLSVTQRKAVAVRALINEAGANSVPNLLNAITERTRMVFCCSPNPPSGGMMSQAEVEELIAKVPEKILLVMDEAYHEFGVHAGGPDILKALSARRGPWVNLRTFSKAYGLAGIRAGYAFCSSDEVADSIRRTKTVYGPGATGLAGAVASLNDEAYLAKTLDAIAQERSRLSSGLLLLGLKPFPSAANFVSVALPMPAAVSMAKLHARGILVRDWRDPSYMQEIRITVGMREDTDAVLKAIEEILSEIQSGTSGSTTNEAT